MTLEPKAQLVVGTGMDLNLPDSIMTVMPDAFRPKPYEDETYNEMVKKIRTYLPGTAGVTVEFPELGITAQTLSDGPEGLRISPVREGDDQTYLLYRFPDCHRAGFFLGYRTGKKCGRCHGQRSQRIRRECHPGSGYEPAKRSTLWQKLRIPFRRSVGYR